MSTVVITLPRFKSHFQVRVLPPDLVFFIHESGYRVIQGELLCAIAPLVSGNRRTKEIAAKLKQRWSKTDVEWGLLLLEAEGYLSDTHKDLDDGFSLLQDSLNIDPKEFAKNTGQTPIRLVSFGRCPTTEIESILNKLGIAVSQRGTLTCALVDDYACEELEEINRSAIETNSRWMIVKPVGSVLWFGPVFSPNAGPCWKCLAERLKEKRRLDSFLRANHAPEPPSSDHSQLPIRPATTAVLNLAVLRLLQEIGADTHSPHLFTFDTKSMLLEKHVVVRRMDCPACGTKSAAFPSPLKMKQNRASAGNLFERYKHHISFRTGIVDELKAIPVEPPGLIYSAVADHIFVPHYDRETLLRKGLTQKSWGRGTTEEQARTGALLESLERYSGVFRGSEFRIQQTQRDLGDQAISLNQCLNFSETQYINRNQWNKLHTKKEWVPMRLDPERTIDWSPVWSLTNSRFRYLPTAYCYYGYPLPEDHFFCRADSNGNAAGETLEQAILHGFLEIVERDCAAMWWFNRARRPGIDLDAFCDSYLHGIGRFYKKNAARKLWVLDITNDFNIPCFVALSARANSASPDFLLGIAADFDPLVGIKRAITEMNQLVAARLQKSRKASKPRSIPDEPYLHPAVRLKQKTFEDYKFEAPADATRLVRRCVRLAKEHSMETFILDQTRSDVGLPVVKVIVPGMRQIWRRLAPGRLYDVPFELGWIRQYSVELRLNTHGFLT